MDQQHYWGCHSANVASALMMESLNPVLESHELKQYNMAYFFFFFFLPLNTIFELQQCNNSLFLCTTLNLQNILSVQYINSRGFLLQECKHKCAGRFSQHAVFSQSLLSQLLLCTRHRYCPCPAPSLSLSPSLPFPPQLPSAQILLDFAARAA